MDIKLEEKLKRIAPDKFLGKIHHKWAEGIIRLIEGKKILELGCGYGFLTEILKNQGFDSCGIDIDKESIDVGHGLYPQADLRVADAYNLPFEDNSFDTVIFHEVIHHLEFDRALKEAHRLAKEAVIIFDPNPNFIVKLCRKLIRHEDPEAPFNKIIAALKGQGFAIAHAQFSSLFAMPLSGGFVGPKLCPDVPKLHDFLIRADEAMCGFLKAISCDKFFCWRYLIKAQKER